MSLKFPFLIGAVTLTSTGLSVGSYFSIKSLVFEYFWDNKISELEIYVKELLVKDYENDNNSLLIQKIEKLVAEMLNWLKEKIGNEKFENIFLKLLGDENLPINIIQDNNRQIKKSDEYENKIKQLKEEMTDSDRIFYEKAKQLDEICKKIVRKIEGSRENII